MAKKSERKYDNNQLFREGKFDLLYTENEGFVNHLCMKFANVEPDFDELKSVCNLAFSKCLEKFNPDETKWIAYYATVATNEILMYARKKRRIPEMTSLDVAIRMSDSSAKEITLADMVCDPDTDIEEDLMRQADIQMVRQAIQLLDPRQQEIILHRMQGKQQADIAVLIGISQSYVARIEKKALSKLKDILTLAREGKIDPFRNLKGELDMKHAEFVAPVVEKKIAPQTNNAKKPEGTSKRSIIYAGLRAGKPLEDIMRESEVSNDNTLKTYISGFRKEILTRPENFPENYIDTFNQMYTLGKAGRKKNDEIEEEVVCVPATPSIPLPAAINAEVQQLEQMLHAYGLRGRAHTYSIEDRDFVIRCLRRNTEIAIPLHELTHVASEFSEAVDRLAKGLDALGAAFNQIKGGAL